MLAGMQPACAQHSVSPVRPRAVKAVLDGPLASAAPEEPQDAAKCSFPRGCSLGTKHHCGQAAGGKEPEESKAKALLLVVPPPG